MKLEGKHVRLVPIVRGDNDERGLIAFAIWNAIEQAGDWDKIFWQLDSSDPRKGDLYHWLSYLTDENDPSAGVLIEDIETNAMAGVFWFNQFKREDRSANIHLWMDPAHRGAPTREAGLLVTEYAFEVLKLQKIIGISPHPIIRNFGLRCGYKETERGDFDINGMRRTLYRVERSANG